MDHLEQKAGHQDFSKKYKMLEKSVYIYIILI